MGREVWAIDSEWGFRDCRIDEESAFEPVVLCAVGLYSKERHHFWGQDARLGAFFRAQAGDLFVSHYAIAEMKYLLRLGIPLPDHWFDTFVAWRCRTNSPGHLEAGLSGALHEAGLPHLAPAAKKELQLRILHLDFAEKDRGAIVEYCSSDCDGCLALYRQLDHEDVTSKMAHWVVYLQAVARMELRGIPFDYSAHMAIRKGREDIRQDLIRGVNVVHPVYENGSFRRQSFFEWCDDNRIVWPNKRSATNGAAYRSLDRETLKAMEGRHPFIAEVRQVKKTLDALNERSCVVDQETHRHHFATSVFRTVTGRNAPKNFVFAGPKWSRFLIVPESPEHVLVYVDFVAQEIGLAAALSGDLRMREMYEANDCHMQFAVRAGAAPSGATKAAYGEIRKRYKTVNLGVQYGQTAHGIAQRLGIPFREAEGLVDEHQRLFPDFWTWSDMIVQGSFDRGWIATPCGWRSGVPAHSNARTWMNWPMQATGGDIMRLTVTYLDRQNVRILAPVHDGFLISCRRDQLDDLRAAVDYACSAAVEHVVPGFRLRWDVQVYENRFEDEDGLPLWNKLQSILKAIA
jgi:DNA polymerase-1